MLTLQNITLAHTVLTGVLSFSVSTSQRVCVCFICKTPVVCG